MLFLAVFVSGTSFQCGDCDGNGFVNILDALIASRYAVGLAALDEPYFSACNVVGTLGNKYLPSAQVSSIDAMRIAQFTVGKIRNIDCILELPVLFISDRDGDKEIYMMNQDGSNQRPIRFNGSSLTDEANPVWSPDGEWIAFSDADITDLYMIPRNSGLLTIPKHLTPNSSRVGFSSLDWSPNGKELLTSASLISDGTYKNITILDLATLSFTAIPVWLGNSEINPSWNADGSKIAYLSKALPSWAISTMNKDGTNKQVITSNYYFGPDWGHGGKIAYYKSVNSKLQIFIMDEDGTNQKQITFNNQDYSIFPKWSRDGTMLFYYNGNWPGPPYDVYGVVSTQNGTITRLTNNPFNDISPSQ